MSLYGVIDGDPKGVDNFPYHGGDDLAPLAESNPELLPVVIDAVTHEPVEGVSFRNIDEAEKYFFKLAGREESVKYAQARTVIAIQRQNLYSQRLDPFTGELFDTFDAYLKYLSAEAKRLDGSKKRTIQAYMAKVRIFDEQLGYDDGWMNQLGYHLDLMLPAAARSKTSLELSDHDEPTATGGTRLGRERFVSLVEEIAGLVLDDTVEWSTDATKERVAEILGKDTSKGNIAIVAHFEGNSVVVDKFEYTVDEVRYGVGAAIPLEEFRLIPGGISVEGLGDSWRGNPKS